MPDQFEGVPVEGPAEECARKTADLARRGLVTYRAVAVAPRRIRDRDDRTAPRRRTRLSSGKILDRRNNFLTECSICDSSVGGVRVTLARNLALPEVLHFYEDESGQMFRAQIVWRRDGRLGLRWLAAIREDVKATVRKALARRYYAVPD